MKKSFIISLILSTLYSITVFPTNSFTFETISIEQGLSQATVYDIIQDKFGKLWVATGDGLNCYDGNKFTVFRNNDSQNNSISLLDNNILSLYIDSKQLLWIGTSMGLACYDFESEHFSNYPFMLGNTKIVVNDILELDNGNILIASNKGIYRFSQEKGYVKCAPSLTLEVNKILKKQHRILLGTDKGLYTYYPATDIAEKTWNRIDNIPIMTMADHNLDPEKVWVGTEGLGLFLIDVRNMTYIQYLSDSQNKQSLTSNYVRSIEYDQQNRLWVGTFVGLNILQANNKDFHCYHHDLYDVQSISQNSIKAILRDHQGGMWLGTHYGGLNYFHPHRDRFVNYIHRKGKNSINDNVVSIMKADNNNNVWIGTNENGLNCYNQTKDCFSFYINDPANPYSLPANNVKALLLDSTFGVWVGTHGGGLSYLSKKTGDFNRFCLNKSTSGDENVYALEKDKNGRLWIGSLKGLFCMDMKTKEVTSFVRDKNGIPLTSDFILSLFMDRNENIWIGTNNGINCFESKYNQLKLDFLLKENTRNIYSFTEDRNGNIWIGTSEGLLIYETDRNRLKDLSTDIGFPSISIYGVQEDEFGRFWISTGNGLFVLDNNQSNWVVYKKEDGIQSNLFSAYSYCMDHHGRMFFGGIKGFTAFYPSDITISTDTEIPILNKLTLFHNIVKPNDDSGILKTSLNSTKSIQFTPKQSVFTISFSVSNYYSKNNNSFAYQLIGFDADWIYTNLGEARYSNLPSGVYKLRVKAPNSDGIWSEEFTELEIIILDYWWNTWWARLLLIALFTSIIVFILKIYTNKKFIERELYIERKEQKQKEELNESKIRFFINLSHELRTPLTLILSPIHQILKKGVPDPWQKEQLECVLRSANRIMRLVNQVLDYRKSEMGAMNLNVVKGNFSEDARASFLLFRPLSQQKNITYYFNDLLIEKEYYYDPQFLERILFNLIGNAFKYTPDGGVIEVNLLEHEGMLKISIQDTGCGISQEKQAAIFNRFYQVNDKTEGTGIGLSLVKNLVLLHKGRISVKSDLDKGSLFTVELPGDQYMYKREEIDANSCREKVCFISAGENIDTTLSDYAAPLNEVIHQNDNDLSKKKILIVEDDIEISKYLQMNLGQNYQIVSTENGRKAIQILEETACFDLIISDVMMPEMDGIRFCKYLKNNIYYSHIPILLLTAKTDVSSQIEGLHAGADDYITKPFVYEVLKAKIENVFKARDILQQHYSKAKEPDIVKLATNQLDQEFLQKAIAIIEKNMENPDFSTEDFSSEMGMSRSNLYLKLKALTNESAVIFIRRIRFNQACKLLKEGRYNVTEISSMIGFTPSYFATSFKKHMGCLPSEYVKKYQEHFNE